MAPYTAILRQLTPQRFAELLVPLNRQSKERYFARHGVRTPKLATAGFARPGQKNELRAAKLHESLQRLDDEPLAEELVRLYLLHHREVLVAAMDHLKIPHEGGLTDSPELVRLSQLDAAARAALQRHLVEEAKVPEADVTLYLDFMAIAAQPEER